MTTLLLASTSPRRTELLDRAGLAHAVVEPPADIDVTPDIPAEVAVQLVARAKAAAVAARRPDGFVVAADTIVVGPRGPMGKPGSPTRAAEMLRGLSGRLHTVLTGVCVLAPQGAEPLLATSSTAVSFRPLTEGEVAAYVATGEPLDKAGGYAIQGGGAEFVDGIVGRVDTVIGLDVRLTFELLNRAGRLPALPEPADAVMGMATVPPPRPR